MIYQGVLMVYRALLAVHSLLIIAKRGILVCWVVLVVCFGHLSGLQGHFLRFGFIEPSLKDSFRGLYSLINFRVR